MRCAFHREKERRDSSFSNLNENFPYNVRFNDDYSVNAMRRNDIKIRTMYNFVETISNVLYVLNLKSDLLSATWLSCYNLYDFFLAE